METLKNSCNRQLRLKFERARVCTLILCSEPNGMGPWCDESVDNCKIRNLWGNHNLTTSLYLPWYHAVSAAIVSVDPKLQVGGPASSDCCKFADV